MNSEDRNDQGEWKKCEQVWSEAAQGRCEAVSGYMPMWLYTDPITIEAYFVSPKRPQIRPNWIVKHFTRVFFIKFYFLDIAMALVEHFLSRNSQI